MAFLARHIIARRSFVAAKAFQPPRLAASFNLPRQNHRSFSKAAEEGTDGAAAAAECEAAEDPVKDAPDSLEAKLAKQEEQLKAQKDQLLRALADAENARAIARRDVDSARQFAVTKFAKSMLEVADNLNLAMTSIPQEVLLSLCGSLPPNSNKRSTTDTCAAALYTFGNPRR